MQLEITRKFQKQVSGCNNDKVKSEIKRILEFAEMTQSVTEIKNL